ncbi:MAG: NosD domain-containing protein, partial [Nanoarchaeota archaeon]
SMDSGIFDIGSSSSNDIINSTLPTVSVGESTYNDFYFNTMSRLHLNGNADRNNFINNTINTTATTVPGIYFESSTVDYPSVNIFKNNTILSKSNSISMTRCDCSNQFDSSNTGSEGKPILYITSDSYVLSNVDNYSQIILCGADYAVLDNITISNPTYNSDGLFICDSHHVTIKNSNLSNDEQGIYFRTSTDDANIQRYHKVINNTISNNDAAGISIDYYASYITFENNTFKDNTHYHINGVRLTNFNINNNYFGNLQGSAQASIRFSTYSYNNLIDHNIFYSDSASSFDSIYLWGLVGGNTISNNLFNVSRRVINLRDTDSNKIFNNTIEVRSGDTEYDYVFQLYGNSINNSIYNNTILRSNATIFKFYSSAMNNNITNNIINSATGYVLEFKNEILSGNYLIDQEIGNYSFFGRGSIVYFKDSDYGEIRFSELINGSGDNLSNDIKIGYNSIFVNSSNNIGLNRSANLSIYGLSSEVTDVEVDSNDDGIFEPCDDTTDPSCTDISYSDGILNFIVSHFTEFRGKVTTPGENACGELDEENRIYTLTTDIQAGANCFDVKANNITLDCDGHTIIGDGTGIGVRTYAFLSDYTTLENCILDNFSIGIYWNNAHNGIIRNNTVFDLGHGIWLEASDNNIIEQNRVNGSGISGIEFAIAENNTFTDNTIIGNYSNGIFNSITTNLNNNILNNHIAGSLYGIRVAQDSVGSIGNNMIYNCSYGIYLIEAHEFIISNNNVSRNNYGIYVNRSSENLIYNNLFDNINNTYLEFTTPYVNNWNASLQIGPNIIGGNNIGGNYYSDYTGYDSDGDGVGEVVYTIPGTTADNTDYLPLTNNVGIGLTDCANMDAPGNYYLTQDIIDSTAYHCMNISANNVVLDCQGHKIDALVGSGYHGIYAYVLSNITVKNCFLSDWPNFYFYILGVHNSYFENVRLESEVYGGFGFHVGGNHNYFVGCSADSTANYGFYLPPYVNNNTFVDVTANGSLYGFYLNSAGSTKIINSTIKDNSQYDIFIQPYSTNYCNDLVENTIGTGDKPIVYFNETVNLQNWDNNFSEMILCNADNSVLSNIKLDGTKTGIILAMTDNAILDNINITNNYIGLRLYSSTNNIIKNSYFEGNGDGIYASANNNVFNATYVFNNSRGIALDSSDYNTIDNCIFEKNNVGLLLLYSDKAKVRNITSFSNTNYGLSIVQSRWNNISDSTIFDNDGYGVYVYSSSWDSYFWNNLFNNTENIYFNNIGYSYGWNLLFPESGQNIIGGIKLGGNYWAKPNGLGYSEICPGDGTFCYTAYDPYNDEVCILGKTSCHADNADYYPLTKNTGVVALDSCGVLDEANRVYTLPQNVESEGDCFIIAADNITLDCDGHNITYAKSLQGFGVQSLYNVNSTIRNCNITYGGALTAENYGLFVYYNRNSLVENNIIRTGGSGDSNVGIRLWFTNNSNVRNNLVYTHGVTNNVGVTVSVGNYNNITSNEIYTNGTGGFNHGMVISEQYAIIRNNTIVPASDTLVSSHCLGISLSGNHSVVEGNNITSNGGTISVSGINLQYAGHNLIRDNNIFVYGGTDNDAIQFGRNTYYNIITMNTLNAVGAASDAFELGGVTDYPQYNNISNNTLLNVTMYDLNFIDTEVSDNYFIDQPIRGYRFDPSGNKLNFKDSKYGEIQFLNKLKGSGDNLSNELKIGYNSIYVNGSNTGLNKRARIRIYDLNFITTYPEFDLEDDGTYEECTDLTDPICNSIIYLGSILQFTTNHFTTFRAAGGVSSIIDCKN